MVIFALTNFKSYEYSYFLGARIVNSTWVALGTGSPLPNLLNYINLGGYCPRDSVMQGEIQLVLLLNCEGFRFLAGGCGKEMSFRVLHPSYIKLIDGIKRGIVDTRRCNPPADAFEGLTLEVLCGRFGTQILLLSHHLPRPKLIADFGLCLKTNTCTELVSSYYCR
jgi:hypothetical protein